MSAEFISVSVLNSYIKSILSSEDILQNISLVGEVSGISCSGAHSYFTLKDANDAIACTCFNYARTYQPKTGEAVILTGSVDYYAKFGKLSFVARSIKPFGMGLLAIRLEELKKRLTEQGYFDPARKVSVPKYCDRVAVITSKTGAVIKDIITTVRKKNQILNLELYDVRVQGMDAVASIIRALTTADKQGYDAIVIARGGGSLEDLMPFNDEMLVKAIFDAKTPVISAVGHETDFTLCDMVADIRTPTPTAAGELIAFDQVSVIKQFDDKYMTIKRQLIGQVREQHLALTSMANKMVGRINLLTATYSSIVQKSALNACKAIEIALVNKDNSIRGYLARLEANSPLRILKQGYSKVYDAAGKATDAVNLGVGEEFNLLGEGVKLTAKVLDKKLVKH